MLYQIHVVRFVLKNSVKTIRLFVQEIVAFRKKTMWAKFNFNESGEKRECN